MAKPAPLRPPRGADENALYILSGGLLMMSSFSLVQSLLHRWMGAAWTLSGEILCLLAAMWFTRLGRTVWAALTICLSELICGLLLTSLFGPAFTDEAMLLFPLILVVAAVALDGRWYAAFAALVVVSVAGSGALLAQAGTTAWARVFNTVNMLLTTAVAVGLLARNLKRRSQQSRDAEQEIQALSARLIHAQEAERSRLARDLHDDVGQQIAALSLGLSNLKRAIPEAEESALRQSELLQTRMVEFSESIRRMSHELHPAALEFSGLGAALRGYCEEFSTITQIQVRCRVFGGYDGVPGEVALAVYRIAQEALQNVAKHAKVNQAEVNLSRNGGSLELVVADRGAGMPSQARRTGIGLISIRERTRLVNGSVSFESLPNQGTTLRVMIPL
ncbi:MAG: sensor histidine kinase [Candidatus Solibacter sp.]